MRNHDNPGIQPCTGNVHIIEDFNTLDEPDGTGGDVWACLMAVTVT